jgi:hypothetical protein
MLRKDALHRADGALLHVGEDVGIGVHRLGDVRVAEHLLNYLRVDVLRQEERGARVAEVVEPYPRESGAFQKRIEGSVYQVSHVERTAREGGENEVSFQPKRPQAQLLLILRRPVTLEGVHRTRRQPYAQAALLHLRRGRVEGAERERIGKGDRGR